MKRPLKSILSKRTASPISQGSGSTGKTYIYRGADIDTMRNQILSSGEIPGTTSDILVGSPRQLTTTIDSRPYVEELDWLEGPPNLPADFKQVPVTGGVTDNIGATRRFRDSKGLIAVMDASKTSFEKCEYTYEWMDEHPGVLTQILTTTDGEVRVESVGLWGLLDKAVFVDKPDRYVIEHWQPDNLPATTSDSMFAQEDEWFADEAPVYITDAFEGITSVTFMRNIELSINDTSETMEEAVKRIYRERLNELGKFDEPLYMIAIKGRGTDYTNPYRPQDIGFAINRSGLVDPEDIPQKFLGNTDNV